MQRLVVSEDPCKLLTCAPDAKLVLFLKEYNPLPVDIGMYEEHFVVCYGQDQLNEYINGYDSLEPSGKSYLISGYNGMPKFYIHLSLRSWTMVTDLSLSTRVDYVRHEGRIAKHFDVICHLKNSIVNPSLRCILKDSIPNTFKGIVPPTYHYGRWNKKELVYPGRVLVVKPINGYRGQDISIVTSQEELDIAKAIIDYNDEWYGVLTSYYIYPDLFMGKKYHCRSWILVASWGWSSIRLARIMTAKKPYVCDKFHKMSIHDSCLRNTDDEYLIRPDDWRLSHIEEIKERVSRTIRHNPMIGYKECDYAYDLIAVDIMFDVDQRPWLLKCKVGSNERFKDREVQRSFWEWEKSFIRSHL
jgi:hypothetical protein